MKKIYIRAELENGKVSDWFQLDEDCEGLKSAIVWVISETGDNITSLARRADISRPSLAGLIRWGNKVKVHTLVKIIREANAKIVMGWKDDVE